MKRMTQTELEAEMQRRGAERFNHGLSHAIERDKEFEVSPGSGVTKRLVKRALPAMRALRRDARARQLKSQQQGLRLGGWEHLLEPMDSEYVAFFAVRVALGSTRGETRLQDTCTAIGRAICTELMWQEAKRTEAKLAKEREYSPPNRIQMMRKRVAEVNPKTARKWLRKYEDLGTTEWTRSEMFKVGAVVLDALLRAIPEDLSTEVYYQAGPGKRKSVKGLKWSSEFLEELAASREHESALCAWLMPMIEEPDDWRMTDDGIRGGYRVVSPADAGEPFSHASFIKGKHRRPSHTQEEGVSVTVLASVNIVQRTKWAINSSVLDVAEKALCDKAGPLPFDPPVSMPESLPADVWAKMSKEERLSIKAKREEVHSHNNRAEAKALAAYRVYNTAKEMAKYGTIYFPHAIDWRGRVYPLPQDLHPQADDFAKAFLRFDKSRALGEHGLKWLVFHLANCYGMDKGEREDQAEWFNTHSGDIFAVASDPFRSGLEFWSQADEPWQFLAACIEVCQAFALDDPTEFESSLPVQIDGTCNGLQHLSAMGLDPVGAKSVNLLPGPRQDIYKIVADKVSERVEDDFIRNKDVDGSRACAAAWHMKVTRKTVKRAVMTTPYGVTPIGIRDQLIKDRHCDGLTGDRYANAEYMKTQLLSAISSTIDKGTKIMAWLQDCADILAEQGKGISWTTPAGLRVTQCYRTMTGQKITTLMGQLIFSDGDGGEIAKRKQVTSVAPNVIHSFDAAHMMLTVLDTRDCGYSYSMVHDSFGVHAGDMEHFSWCARTVFADIYSVDWFEALSQDFSEQGIVHVPAAPERGDLDIEEVLDAEYFFA